MSKNDKFWLLSDIFMGLEISLEMLKQIFCRCSFPCMFSSEKDLRWYYPILSPKDLPENAKNI